MSQGLTMRGFVMGERLENAKRLYMEAIQDGHAAEAIEKYSGARYTQHSTPVKDGKDGFVEFFEDFHRRNPVREIQILRGFEDGPFVFLHVLQILNHGEFRYVTADIFETDQAAKMIEHWDIIEEVVDGTASGHTQVDGPTEAADPDRTEANKALVSDFLQAVMVKGAYEKLNEYVSESAYVEHSSRDEPMIYREIHRVIGSGSFVAVLAKVSVGKGAGIGGTEFAVIDLFRVADDKVVEHWSVGEKIAPEETWVNSGKF